nr:hypothetical protein [Pandoravirus massiliensis]
MATHDGLFSSPMPFISVGSFLPVAFFSLLLCGPAGAPSFARASVVSIALCSKQCAPPFRFALGSAETVIGGLSVFFGTSKKKKKRRKNQERFLCVFFSLFFKKKGHFAMALECAANKPANRADSRAAWVRESRGR